MMCEERGKNEFFIISRGLESASPNPLTTRTINFTGTIAAESSDLLVRFVVWSNEEP